MNKLDEQIEAQVEKVTLQKHRVSPTEKATGISDVGKCQSIRRKMRRTPTEVRYFRRAFRRTVFRRIFRRKFERNSVENFEFPLTENPTEFRRKPSEFVGNSVGFRKKMGILRPSSARAFKFWGGGVLAGYIILEREGVCEREGEGRERK